MEYTSHDSVLKIPAGRPERLVRDLEIDFSRLLYLLSEHLDVQIQLADMKANLVLGANAVLLATWGLQQGSLRDLLVTTPSPKDDGFSGNARPTGPR